MLVSVHGFLAAKRSSFHDPWAMEAEVTLITGVDEPENA
jgi:hypothetical protein